MQNISHETILIPYVEHNIAHLVFQVLGFPKTNLLSFLPNAKPCSLVSARGSVGSIVDGILGRSGALAVPGCGTSRGARTPANQGSHGLHSKEGDVRKQHTLVEKP